MKRKSKWFVYSITGSILAVMLAACGPHRHDPEERAEWMMEKVTKELELNETQVAKLNLVKNELLKAGKDFRQRRDDSRQTVVDLIQQPTLDRDKAVALVNQHTAAINEQAPQIIAALGDFYDSLSPEQQAELREHIQDRMEHHRHYWH